MGTFRIVFNTMETQGTIKGIGFRSVSTQAQLIEHALAVILDFCDKQASDSSASTVY